MIKLSPISVGCGIQNPPAVRPSPTLHWQCFSPFAQFVVILIMLGFVLYNYSTLKGYIADEGFHAGYVDALRLKRFDNLPTNVTTPPLFHAVIALVTHLSGATSKLLELMRYVQFSMSIVALPFFYLIARQLKNVDCDIRLLLCASMPIYLPIFGLVYTDPPAVALTMIMVYCVLKGNLWAAAIAGLVGLGFRQMTIIWVGFCGLFVIACAVEERLNQGYSFSKMFGAQFIFRLVLKLLPMAIPVIAFVAFIVFNKGLVAGDRDAHNLGINVSGFYFFLISSFVLFLPYCLSNFSAVVSMVFEKKWVWFVTPVLFLIYMAFYKVEHPYNGLHMGWWIHNALLHISTQEVLFKTLFFIPAIWMMLTFLIIAKRHEKPWQMYMLYAFTLISFLPMPLIELRYHIIGQLLFILWKPSQERHIEQLTLVYWIVLSTFIVYGSANRMLFL